MFRAIIATIFTLSLATGAPAAATLVSDQGSRAAVAQLAEPLASRAVDVARMAGSDRYATAAAVAGAWPSGQAVAFIANGRSYPDALSAAARAGDVNAPILLTDTNSIPEQTAKALQRLNAERIVVVGGERVVSAQVAGQLRNYAGLGGVERVWGKDRYATAAAMAGKYSKGSAKAFLASGQDFPDALAGAALAGHQEVPVLLTRSDRLDPTTVSRLKNLGVDELVVLGGSKAVSSATAKQAASYTTTGRYSRLAGENRYSTAAIVAQQFPKGAKQVFVASGEGFPEALVGAALAGRRGVPLVLTPSKALGSEARGALEHHRPGSIVVLGGSDVVSSRVVTELAQYADREPSSEAMLGGYLGSPNESPDERFKSSFGDYPDLASTYYQADGRPGGKLNHTYEQARIDRGTIPVLTVTSARGPHTMAEIGSGKADKWIDHWADQLAALDGEVWFTFDHEFEVKYNQGKMAAGTTLQQYVKAFNRFQSRVTVRAQNVKFLYWYGYSDKAKIDPIGAGIDAPDIIALDPYVFAHRNPGVTFEEMATPHLGWLKSRSWYRNQPIIFAEFAKDLSFGDREVGTFLADLRPRLAKLGVTGAIYFARDKRGDIMADITNSAWPAARQAYRASVME